MIELTWGQLRDPDLNGALNSLARQRVEYKTTLKLVTMLNLLEEEQKKARETAKVLADKYGKTDEAGKWSLKEDVKPEEFSEAEKEYLSTKAKFRFAKINASELEGTKLSAIEYTRLEPLLEKDL